MTWHLSSPEQVKRERERERNRDRENERERDGGRETLIRKHVFYNLTSEVTYTIASAIFY